MVKMKTLKHKEPKKMNNNNNNNKKKKKKTKIFKCQKKSVLSSILYYVYY